MARSSTDRTQQWRWRQRSAGTACDNRGTQGRASHHTLARARAAARRVAVSTARPQHLNDLAVGQQPRVLLQAVGGLSGVELVPISSGRARNRAAASRQTSGCAHALCGGARAAAPCSSQCPAVLQPCLAHIFMVLSAYSAIAIASSAQRFSPPQSSQWRRRRRQRRRSGAAAASAQRSTPWRCAAQRSCCD